jgi:hypothetical protein
MRNSVTHWPTLALLLILSTGCDFLKNDFKDSPLPGVKIYDPSLEVGASAREIVSDQQFKSLVVEIQAVRGFAPPQEALNKLHDFLAKTVRKRKIQILPVQEIPPLNVSSYTLGDVRGLEYAYRRRQSRHDQIAIYFLFLDKPSADDSVTQQLLGQAHMNTSVVIYEDTIQKLLAKRAAPAPMGLAEATVMAHEMGHVMGLVNNGLAPVVASHQQHGRHCSDPMCLMAPDAETSALLQNLSGEDLPRLDDECLRDLRANGAK